MSIPGPDRTRLRILDPKLHILEPLTLIWRIYRSEGSHPVRWNEFRHFGPVAARFDHHLEDAEKKPYEQERGVLYAAPDFITCIAEFFQASRHLDRRHGGPRIVAFHLLESIDLIDLSGRFLTLAGCHQGLHSSPLRRRARAWSRALYETCPEGEGLLYRSKMAVDLPAYTFYERAVTAIPDEPFADFPLTDPRLEAPLAAAVSELGYSLG